MSFASSYRDVQSGSRKEGRLSSLSIGRSLDAEVKGREVSLDRILATMVELVVRPMMLLLWWQQRGGGIGNQARQAEDGVL